ncbi:unnamed protein product [Paramecium pentaurelia]|uniref:ubiquitinyl hydrolase 1 n=1 Tax=Paramecium pentaurelia TaxID=43138 RepID=A0A8S1VXI8_9CILI|nr:unnamed protein product [Paramecium pentaurelia]
MISDEVQKYKKMEEKFLQEFHSKNGSYFLISSQWLNNWKKKVGYEGDPNNSIQLGNINIDIGQKPKQVLKYDPFELHPWNIQLKPNLVEGIDYQIIDNHMWQFLKEFNKKRVEFTIERDSYLNNEGQRQIQAYLKCIKFVPIFPSALQKLQTSMIEGEQQISPIAQISEVVTILSKTLKTVTSARFVTKDNIRLYKLGSSWNLENLKIFLLQQFKEKKQLIEFTDIEFLNPADNKQIKDYNFEKDQILIMDAKEIHNTFLIQNNLFELEEKCIYCSNYQNLKFNCVCKKVKYCSESCLQQHSNQHIQICEKQNDTDEILINLLPNPQSKQGLTGLRNLGNTCYMNSALQCLSNTPEISRYFLDNSFKFDINQENALGTNGEFASLFSYLLKRLWFDKQSSISPFQFKKLVGKLSPNFAGNAQHDAQEFITLTLDLLNEDLNRIKVKPYVEIPDNNNRPDDIVSQEQWDCFKKRNDSLIVDELYGQYRSKLQCPICQKISITFDPYLMVNVTIPQEQKKVLEFYIIDPENLWLSKTVTHYYEPELRLKEVLQFKSKEWLNCEWDQIILTLSSTFSIEEVFLDQRLELLKKQLKQDKKLQLRKLTVQEQIISNEQQVHVLIHNQIQTLNNWKKDITPTMYFILSQNYKYKEIHMFLFDCFKNVLKNFAEFDQNWLNSDNLEDIYQQNILDKYWKIMFKSNQRYQVNCSYCYKAYCNDCPLEFVDKIFGDCFQREDKLLQPEIQIIWLKPCREKIDDIYTEYQKIYDPNYKAPFVNLNWDKNQKNNKQQQAYTLEHCLEYSTKPEQLQADNTWYCSGCKDHVQAHKTLQIYKTSKILIFHLKRFKNSYKLFKSKLQTNILYPEKLDMSNFVLHKENNNLYELYAICNHIGESGSGHYTAFCKNNGDWYKFDDSIVSKETNSIVTPNAYVLFYRRIDQINVEYDLQAILKKNIDLLLADEVFKKHLQNLQQDNSENIDPQKQDQSSIHKQQVQHSDQIAKQEINVINNQSSCDQNKVEDYGNKDQL